MFPQRIHRLRIASVTFLALALTFLCITEAREFTSANGERKIEAEIVSVDLKAETVTLRTADGRTFDSPLSLFSEADREIIREFKPPAKPETKTGEKPIAEQIERLDEMARSNFPSAKDAEKILPLLELDTHHAIRRFAARAAGSIPSAELIPPLIALLTDRVASTDALDSLVRLTEEDFGKNIDSWNGWWKKNRADFRPACLSLRELASRRAKEDRKKPDPDPNTPLFYGRELLGKDILFLLDISGSMKGPRLDKLKMELQSMIEFLPAECSFALIFFPHQVFPEKGLGSAEFEFKEKALKVIKDIDADGGTPMGGAVNHAFDVIDGSTPVDTIYLLSDGEPGDLSPQKVRQLIAERNAAHYVLVHTIAIGEDSKLLKSISSDHGGFHLWSATKDELPFNPKLVP